MTIELSLAGTDAVALVDDDCAHLVRYRWRVAKEGYVYRNSEDVILLHQVILAQRPLPGFVVAWRNGNRLDCRRRNLHYVTFSTKREGTRRRPNRSGGVLGVYRSRGKYCAALRVNGVLKRLGRYDTLEAAAAAVARFEKARAAHG